MTAPQRNPLFWTGLAVIGLILFIFLGSDRNGTDRLSPERYGSGIHSSQQTVDQPATEPASKQVAEAVTEPVTDQTPEPEQTAASSSASAANGTIDRSLSAPPGTGARQTIEATRSSGKPYPLTDIFNQAKIYQQNGSLADSHLLYFFSAREGHLESIMQMAMMSDPTQFRAENSLLDQPDALQSYKWYQKAALTGYQPAIDSLQKLRQWALDEAEFGNPYARQLLLNLN